ncbi:MAG TPA: hypothetical protein VNA26_01515 [Chitinophagaceae bacterium]|nr:hypothetical protein [Chitinophagaceae bacterium]
MKTDNSPQNAGQADENIQARLWDYIDGFSEQNETAAVKKLIDENEEWRATYDELLEVHQILSATELEAPPMRFTKNVMDEITKNHIAPATKNYINKNIIRSIAFFFITLIVGFILYGISQIDWSAGNSNTSGIDFSQIDYSRVFNNTFVNIFMMLNVLLGLMLLDRYLDNKKKKQFERL